MMLTAIAALSLFLAISAAFSSICKKLVSNTLALTPNLIALLESALQKLSR